VGFDKRMTTDREPPRPDAAEPQASLPLEAEEQAQDSVPERPRRPERQRRPRPEQNPALDPRLVQLERHSRPKSRVGDASLLVIGIVAFVFGVAMHFWVATSILEDNGEAEQSNTIAATATPEDGTTVTPTIGPRATETPLPDRTSCDEIRGTQYRSVAEREFFLENCTS
jgi:hypothetical protein